MRKDSWCVETNCSEMWYSTRSSKLELEANLVVGGIVEKGKLVWRNQRSEMWYGMRSSKLELEADVVVGGMV